MRKSRWFSSLYIWLVMAFLYAPIAVLIIFSFNDSKSRNTWTGFTLRWYEELFHDRVIMQSFLVMLVVAIVSSVIATVLGTLAAIGLDKMNKKLRSVVMTFTYLPMINPEIITGVALMLLFIYLKMEFGMQTLIVAHITFNVPYVILNVLPKLRQMDKNTYDAGLQSAQSLHQGGHPGDYARHRVRLFDGADLFDGRLCHLLLCQRRFHPDTAGGNLQYDPQKGQPENQRAVHHYVCGGPAGAGHL